MTITACVLTSLIAGATLLTVCDNRSVVNLAFTLWGAVLIFSVVSFD
jgi:hypothetical protein